MKWIPDSLKDEACSWTGHVSLKKLKYKERNELMRKHNMKIDAETTDMSKIADMLDVMYDLAVDVIESVDLKNHETKEHITDVEEALDHVDLGFIITEVQGVIFRAGVPTKK